MVNFERWRSAQYSRELSDKVFKGCREVARQGYRPGGVAPYALERVLLDEKRQFVQVLGRGQRKYIQNQRVTLRPGREEETKIVRQIFTDFAYSGKMSDQIAAELNNRSIPSPGGIAWSPPEALRSGWKGRAAPWEQVRNQNNDIAKKLQEAKERSDFYKKTYHDYSMDLAKTNSYARQ